MYSDFWLILANRMPWQRQEGKRRMGWCLYFYLLSSLTDRGILLPKTPAFARKLSLYSSLSGFQKLFSHLPSLDWSRKQFPFLVSFGIAPVAFVALQPYNLCSLTKVHLCKLLLKNLSSPLCVVCLISAETLADIYFTSFQSLYPVFGLTDIF